MKAGAHDYLVKGNLAGLIPAIERELHINIEIAIYKHRIEKKLKDREHWLYSTLGSLGETVITTDRSGIVILLAPTGGKSCYQSDSRRYVLSREDRQVNNY